MSPTTACTDDVMSISDEASRVVEGVGIAAVDRDVDTLGSERFGTGESETAAGGAHDGATAVEIPRSMATTRSSRPSRAANSRLPLVERLELG